MKKTYSEFTQEYIELYDNYIGLKQEALEDPSDFVIKELELYEQKVKDYQEEGLATYGKEHKELYKDGWNFWFKEDAEIRELESLLIKFK